MKFIGLNDLVLFGYKSTPRSIFHWLIAFKREKRCVQITRQTNDETYSSRRPKVDLHPL
jgi:hypothetical protein